MKRVRRNSFDLMYVVICDASNEECIGETRERKIKLRERVKLCEAIKKGLQTNKSKTKYILTKSYARKVHKKPSMVRQLFIACIIL